MDFKTSILSSLATLQEPYTKGSVVWKQIEAMKEMVRREENETKLAHMLKIMQEILGREIKTVAPPEETSETEDQ